MIQKLSSAIILLQISLTLIASSDNQTLITNRYNKCFNSLLRYYQNNESIQNKNFEEIQKLPTAFFELKKLIMHQEIPSLDQKLDVCINKKQPVFLEKMNETEYDFVGFDINRVINSIRLKNVISNYAIQHFDVAHHRIKKDKQSSWHIEREKIEGTLLDHLSFKETEELIILAKATGISFLTNLYQNNTLKMMRRTADNKIIFIDTKNQTFIKESTDLKNIIYWFLRKMPHLFDNETKTTLKNAYGKLFCKNPDLGAYPLHSNRYYDASYIHIDKARQQYYQLLSSEVLAVLQYQQDNWYQADSITEPDQS